MTQPQEQIIPADEAWRFAGTDRSLMIEAGFKFEAQNGNDASADIQTQSAERIDNAVAVLRDKAGRIVTEDEARILRTRFTNIDAQWKINDMGERERRFYM